MSEELTDAQVAYIIEARRNGKKSIREITQDFPTIKKTKLYELCKTDPRLAGVVNVKKKKKPRPPLSSAQRKIIDEVIDEGGDYSAAAERSGASVGQVRRYRKCGNYKACGSKIVYLATSERTARFKIGVTFNLTDRAPAFAIPDLEIVASVALRSETLARELERSLHRVLGFAHLTGEYFAGHAQVLALELFRRLAGGLPDPRLLPRRPGARDEATNRQPDLFGEES